MHMSVYRTLLNRQWRRMSLTIYVALIALIIIFSVWWKPPSLPKGHPPVIDVPAEDVFRNPRKAYESALKKHGPVIGVYSNRKGRALATCGRCHWERFRSETSHACCRRRREDWGPNTQFFFFRSRYDFGQQCIH